MHAPAFTFWSLAWLAAQTAPAADPKAALAEELARAALRVEELTGAKFQQPPKARIAALKELRERARRDFARECPAELILPYAGLLAALGLGPAEGDLADVWMELATYNAETHYDLEEQLLLLSEELDPVLRPALLIQELARIIVRQHQTALKPAASLDELLARSALREGTATIVGLLSAYEPGRGLETLKLVPDLAQTLKENLEAQSRQKELRRADESTRDLVLFPSLQGAALGQAIIATDAWSRLNEFWRAPPRSTAQVLSPGRYLEGTANLVDYSEDAGRLDLPGYRRVAAGSVGALGLRLWFRKGWPKAGSPDFAAAWSGDRLLVYDQEGAQLLIWRSAWRDEKEAQGFATLAMRLWERIHRGSVSMKSIPGQQRIWRNAGVLRGLERREREVLILVEVPEEKYESVRAAAWEGLKARSRQED